ncbi:MAG TPA: hypothetical protein VGJ63_11365 [Micromonosporaceae bacterium]
MRAGQLVGGLGECPLYRGGRHLHPALGESQQRQARLRVPAVLAPAAVCLIGAREVAADAVDLAEPAEGLAGREQADAPRHQLAGELRLVGRVRPGAAQLQELRPVDATDAGVRAGELRPVVNPGVQGPGPLSGAA